MEENVKEVKDKILKLYDGENYSEAVKIFWAWKEKNPKITDSQSADLHILAAKSFMRYCKQNSSWDEMDKLFNGQMPPEKTPENHAAATEAKNVFTIDDVKAATGSLPTGYKEYILNNLGKKFIKSLESKDCENGNQKNESKKTAAVVTDIKNSSVDVVAPKEEFIKSLKLIDCGENCFVSQRAFSDQDIKKLFIDWGIGDTDSSLSKLSLAYFFIDAINTKFHMEFSIPTELALKAFYKKIQITNSGVIDLCTYKDAFTGENNLCGLYKDWTVSTVYQHRPCQLRLMLNLQNDF